MATDKLRREPDLEDILSEEIVSWLGPERHVTCFPVVSVSFKQSI